MSAGQDAVLLAPDTAIERHVGGDRVYRYRVDLAAGEAVQVVIEQHGVDAVLQVLDPAQAEKTDRKGPIAEFQNAVGYQGEERSDLVADRASTYVLAVRLTPRRRDDATASYTLRIGHRHPATKPEQTLWEAVTLRATASQLMDQGRFADARSLFEKARHLAESIRGPDDAYVGSLWFDLATAAGAMHDNSASEEIFRLHALPILDKALGPHHPYPAWARSRYSLLKWQTGQLREAEQLLLPALATLEETLGTEHLWWARTEMTLGNLRNDLGDNDAAEAAFRRVEATLARSEQSGGASRMETSMYAGVLNNLGEVCRVRSKYDEAQAFYLRALAIVEKLDGLESRDAALEYQNLAIVAREKKKYPEAIAYNMHALAIRERTVGPEHPDVAQVLNNLAIVYHLSGDDAQALETYRRALRIFETSTGPYHRGTLITTGNIARLYAAAGDVTNALVMQHRADAILERQLELNLTIGSERQKLAFVKSIAERTDRTLSLHLDQAPDNADAAGLAALVILQRKGRVLDAMTDTFGAVRERIAATRDPALLDRVDQWKTATAQLARIALNMPDNTSVEERQRQIEALQTRTEQLEADLNEHSSDFRAELRPVTLDAVQAAIPEDGALIEFAVFRPFDPTAANNDEAYGPPHYAAYVLHRRGAPRGIDLGPAAPIDKAIADWRETLRDPTRRDQPARARVVDDAVMRPLRVAIGTAARVLVSPDGDLNLVPFDAMIDERGRYLVERYAISYLTSGRDLLRMQEPHVSRAAPVIVADPLFGEPKAITTLAASHAGTSSPSRRGSVTTADDLSSMYFAPLVASAAEARAIKALFPESTLLLGPRATKVALQQLEGPRVLHIASHGFFLQEPATVKVENPLLRSGVALAGANLSREAHDAKDDGILTALEASGLNLWGTKLVTLSACDTGIGEVRNGEGVYGLRRAFVLAGAETLVMSLWPVSDAVARETMTSYYTGLRANLGRGEALRQAKLALLKRRDRRHPYFWASFIQSGEWADLEGRR